MLISPEQLTKPDFASILLVGAPKTGKTASLATLHRILRVTKQSTKIAFFDLDEDGADTLLLLARHGWESMIELSLAVSKLPPNSPIPRGPVEPWTSDIELHRFTKESLKLGPDDKPGPKRSKKMAEDFIAEFNMLDDRLDPRTKQWKPGQELGCIAVDSTTGSQDMYEDFIWLLRGKEIGEKPPSSKNESSHMIDPGDWRLLGEKVTDIYMTAKQYPCYSFFTAHVDLRQEEVRPLQLGEAPLKTGQFFKVPLLTKALAMRIAKDFSTVLYTTDDFQWVTRPSNSERVQAAGTRGKAWLPPLVTQDFANVLDI